MSVVLGVFVLIVVGVVACAVGMCVKEFTSRPSRKLRKQQEKVLGNLQQPQQQLQPTMTLLVPNNITPGNSFPVQLPDGRVVPIQCPNLPPGNQFNVLIPAQMQMQPQMNMQIQPPVAAVQYEAPMAMANNIK